MRAISPQLTDRLGKTIQSKATNADPRLDLWISRPTTQLTEKAFLEFSDVATNASRASIAVRHTRFGRTSDAVYIGYISGGNAHVAASPHYEAITRHTWADSGFTAPATDISLCFDGTMPRNVQGRYEFITQGMPWVFWVDGGAVYGKQLGSAELVTLAEQNATAISAVRAMWSDVPDFDFGLCLFMILGGTVYYCQLLGGVWQDAAPIPAAGLPTLAAGVTWIDVAAQRTWDYRVALQLLDSTGKLYEVFTQYGGIGSKNAEHIEIKDISADGTLTEVTYHDGQAAEHIEISNITAGALYGGLYSIAVPAIVGAVNVDDGTGDWGKIVKVSFDAHLAATDVAAQVSTFSLADSNGKTFAPGAADLDSDGLTVTLSFGNINNARGELTVSYTPGTIKSMAGTALVADSKSFTPTGLVPQLPPEVWRIENI